MLEQLEDRVLLDATLGTDPLIFDPTPGTRGVDAPVIIGTITYTLTDAHTIQVTYNIAAPYRAKYDLAQVKTTVNDGSAESRSDSSLPENTDSFTHTLALNQPFDVSSLDINACATISVHDVNAVGAFLPAIGTVRVDTNGLITGAASEFDTVVTPGWIATSTSVANDTVTFAADPGWATGEAVRVVQGYTSGPTNTGLVTPPTTTDTTASATYYVRNLGSNTYSFYANYADAINLASPNAPKDIAADLPTTGEIIITGENNALSFLGQTPINESLVPASTKVTLTATTGQAVSSFNGSTEQIVVDSTGAWRNGDRIRVSSAFGGLSTTTTYWVRVIDGSTVELYNGYAAAVDTASTTGRVGLSGTGSQAAAVGTKLNAVDPDDESVTFASDPGWETGTGVRVNATSGNLSASTTYYVRNLGGGVYSFYASEAEARNTDGNADPLSGRRDLTGTVTSSIFANLTTLSFASDHNWSTGSVVRVNASGGGLTAGTNYFVRVVDNDTISLHTTLANAQANLGPVTFTAPIVALITPMFDGWCVDNDRFIGGNELITRIYSSYDLGSLVVTSGDPKDTHLTESGLSPIQTSMVPSSTNGTSDQLSFTTNHGWATQQAVKVTASGGGLIAGTTYYVRSFNGNTVSFHPTPEAANNAGPVPVSTSFTNTGVVPDSMNASTGVETVSFNTDPGWLTQTLVRVTTTANGLTAGSNYYVRNLGSGTYSFHPTAGDAGSDTNRVNLSNTSFTPQIYAVTLASAADTATFASGHGFATGDVVTVAASGGGLTAGTPYTLYQVSGDTFSFHAGDPSADNKVNLTASITSTVNERVHLTGPITSLVFRAQSIDFAVSTEWPNGTPVRVNVADGGLVAGTTYYSRAQSIVGGAADLNSISLYDTREHAQAGGTTGLVTFDDPIETLTFMAGPSVSATDTTNETVDLAAPVAWADGDAVQVSATGGGLTAGVTYYVRRIDADTISFFTSAANAQGYDSVGRVNLTANITATVNPVDASDTSRTVFYVPETLVEYPENLDVVNWVLNQRYGSRLAAGQVPTATNAADTARSPESTSFDNAGLTPTSTDTANETVSFGTDPGWATGTLVRIEADNGGLAAATNYYVRSLGGGLYSFYNSAANATAGNSTGRVNLTAAVTADLYTPSLSSTEDTLTFAPGHGLANGSAVNVSADGGGLDAATTYYLYNVGGDTFSLHTAAAATAANKVNLTGPVEPRVIRLETDNTVTVPVYGWATGLKVQVSETGGGLDAGTDYYIRALNTTTLAFYASAADASNNVNRIDLTGPLASAAVRPYYTAGDVQRTVWELIENTPGDPGNWSPLRVAEILADADAAVGLDERSVDFVPDCGGTVAIILQPFQARQPSSGQITVAQIRVAQIPSYCAESSDCQTLSLNLGSISGVKFEDTDGDGTKDPGEAGLGGWTVYIDANDNATLDAGEAVAVTAADGSYRFDGLLPGRYTVREVQQTGWTQTRAVQSLEVGLSVDGQAAPMLVNQDLGNFKLIDISGVKVHDIDYDGTRGGINDTGDLRLAGLRVYLDTIDNDTFDYIDTNHNGKFDAGDTALEPYTMTDEKGAYSFTALGPGIYDVREDLSSLDSREWQATAALPRPILATSGRNVGGIDFYNAKYPGNEYGTYTLGGYQGKGVPGQYLLQNFGIFTQSAQGGLLVPRASGSDILLSTGTMVQSFLNATSSKPFTGGGVTKYVPSTLEKQFVALTLNIGFDLGTSSSKFGDRILCNLTGNLAVANGLTVSQFWQQVYDYLDGDRSTADGDSAYTLGLSAGDLTSLAGSLNLSFDNGLPTRWAELYLA